MNTLQTEKTKYVLYARKSTESDEKQALSIDSQVKEMLQIAEREDLTIVDIRREAHSAKDSGNRPVFQEILRDIQAERYTGILTWAPDRLSRNAGDLGSIVDLMDAKKLREIKTYSQSFSDSPNEKFLLMILCSQAKLENDNKSINVKRGLRTRVEMGLWPGPAPTGYLKEKNIDRKCHSYIDPERGPIIKEMFEKVAYENWSGRKVYHWLKFDLNFKTVGNKNLSLGNIYVVLQNTFYYGEFTYGGSVYQGQHTPLISKELFIQTQEALKRNTLSVHGYEPKDFAFTKLLVCGKCGSGITAEEKTKKQKNGNTHHYIYYSCCGSRDRTCKKSFLEEKELVKQLIARIDTLPLDTSKITTQFKEEIARFNRFQKMLGLDSNKSTPELDSKKYLVYLLKEGTVEEKRLVAGFVMEKLSIIDKILS